MSKVVTTTVLPDVAGGSVTFGGTGDSVVVTGNDIRTNALQDAGGNAVFTSDGSGTLSGVNSAFGGALKLIQSQTASNSASVSFTSGIDSTYDVYIFKFFDVNPVTDNAQFTFNGSIDGGTNYNVTKTTTVIEAHHSEVGGNTGLAYEASRDLAQSTSYQILTEATGNAADESCAGELYLYAPSSTTYVKHFYGTFPNLHGSEYLWIQYVGGYFNTTDNIDAIDFKMSTGNIDSGVIKLYGISKS